MNFKDYNSEIQDRLGYCAIMAREMELVLRRKHVCFDSEEPFEKLSSLAQAIESCRCFANQHKEMEDVSHIGG